jgi:hypothetical protein
MPAVSKSAITPSSSSSLSRITAEFPADDVQFPSPFSISKAKSKTVWLSRPNNPIVLSFSIFQAS